jgi:hypothetical protein
MRSTHQMNVRPPPRGGLSSLISARSSPGCPTVPCRAISWNREAHAGKLELKIRQAEGAVRAAG